MIPFLLTPLLAVEQPELQITDFAGGLNTHDPSFRLPPGYSPYMRNVYVDNGKLNRVNGFTTLGSTNTLLKVTGIFPFVRDTGQTSFMVTDSSVSLETSDFQTYIFVSSGSTSSALLFWLQVRQKMWGFNGIDFVKTWDGTTLQILDGTKNLPNVPKFKFGAYYQERVFGLNNPSGASDLDWADVASTAGVRLEPDSVFAWPATNNLKIGQGDGQLGTALWIQDGQLRIGKERSIYTLYGSNSGSYQAKREENLGDGVASQESVVQQDGHTYWLGQYGIYEDGVRISDLIEDDVNGISRASINTVENIWDGPASFLTGEFFGSSVTDTGFLRQSLSSSSLNSIGSALPVPNDGFLQLVDTGVVLTGFAVIAPTFTVPSDFIGFPRKFQYWAKSTCGGGVLSFSFLNSETRESLKVNDSNKTPAGGYTSDFQKYTLDLGIDFQELEATAKQINNGKLLINVSTFSPLTSGCVFMFYPATDAASSTILLDPYREVEYVSQITTTTTGSVTAWGTFSSNFDTNGGSVTFYVRSSTSLVNVATKTWSNIPSGVTIGEPTANRFIQWAATMTIPTRGSILETQTPQFIDDVFIDHVEGAGSVNRAFGLSWKNRYWLAVSTDGSNTDTLLLVKSKITNKAPNAWMPQEGINVRSMAKNGDTFYGGAASTGVFYRLDFGTNFNGNSINPIYDTPDFTLGSDFNTKNVLKYRLDGERDSGLNWTVGTSINYGPYSNKTVSFDGTGRQRTILKGVTNPAKTLKLRFSNGQLDKNFIMYGFGVVFQSTEIEE